MADSIVELRGRLARFARERDWEQFHTPKNLAMAVAGEAGELAAVLQWLSEEQIAAELAQGLRGPLADEMADVLLYLVRLADVCGIDLLREANAKIDRNGHRYPADLARGRATKYDALGDGQGDDG
ncbi:nucleotide pyrophosphohydrolase [Actinocatenispora rupis]|uniref:NTP pyrophosphatase, house-cleaning of non-canonical NTPs n=1 Tax=Actinocatenispora rupis TaxID=519421 RepID=A0A8J3NDF6_9ACTN|nr:nucleotide pyrophosphohydrolase [Actinocatenispora rupis]GID15289.1 hypothetical protein Aru02nite_61780 [Actinocatenispora rupis]